MARTVEQRIDEVLMIKVDGHSENVTQEVAQVIKATPASGGAEYIRLQNHETGISHKWNAPVVDWNNTINTDPLVETRWIQE